MIIPRRLFDTTGNGVTDGADDLMIVLHDAAADPVFLSILDPVDYLDTL